MPIDDRKFNSCDFSEAVGLDNPASLATDASRDNCCAWFEDCLGQVLRETVELYLPDANGQSTALARLEISKRRLFCQLGEWVPARFPLRVARFLDHATQAPDETSAYNSIFDAVLTWKPDAIYLGAVRPETLLWRYLQSSILIQKSFRFYSRQGPREHWLIRIKGTFSDYMKRFSAKTRKNRLREIKMLRALGELKLVRVTEVPEIDGFLRAAYAISKQTRQFKRFGWSIAARDPRLLGNELVRLARSRRLRSYLLTCGNTPCSFILGQQSGGTFHPVAAGVDPVWRKHSVGTVLLLLVLEDLFKENSPDFYDLGTSVADKAYLATESYLADDIWLFRRRFYPALVSWIYSACNMTSRCAGDVLQRLNLKGRVLHLMRLSHRRDQLISRHT